MLHPLYHFGFENHPDQMYLVQKTKCGKTVLAKTAEPAKMVEWTRSLAHELVKNSLNDELVSSAG